MISARSELPGQLSPNWHPYEMDRLQNINDLRHIMGPNEIRGAIVGMGQQTDPFIIQIDIVFLCPGNNCIIVSKTVHCSMIRVDISKFTVIGPSTAEIKVQQSERILDHRGDSLLESVNREFKRFKLCMRSGVWLTAIPTYYYTSSTFKSHTHDLRINSCECMFEQLQVAKPAQVNEIDVVVNQDMINYFYQLVYRGDNRVIITMDIMCKLPTSSVGNMLLMTCRPADYNGNGFSIQNCDYISIGDDPSGYIVYTGNHGKNGMKKALLNEMSKLQGHRI